MRKRAVHWGLVVVVLLFPTPISEAQTGNLLINGDAETGDLTGWVDPSGNGFNILTFNTLPVPNAPYEGNFSFWAGITGPSGRYNNEIRQDVDVSAFSAAIDVGKASALFSGIGRTAANPDGSAQDDAEIQVQFLDSTGLVLALESSGVILPFNTWLVFEVERVIPVGTRTTRVRLLGKRLGGISTDTHFDALSLSVSAPEDTDADGFFSDEDCDDNNADINPEADELPGNFVDENCDGDLGDCSPCNVWRNHGEYIRCTSHAVSVLVNGGAITEEEGDALVSSAARSDVGKKTFVPPPECTP